MNLLKELKAKKEVKEEKFPRLDSLIKVNQDDGEIIPFLKLRFGTHSISFEIQCEVPPSASAMDIFCLYLQQIDEKLNEEGLWRNQEWEITNICCDSFTLFARNRETPLYFWKKKTAKVKPEEL